MEIMHRLMFIADEYLREENVNVIEMVPNKLKTEVIGCLRMFSD